MKLNNRGFTLIELLVVISLISLLSSIIMASLASARDKAHLAAGRQFNASLNALNLESITLLPLDEGSGFDAYDKSGNQNNARSSPNVSWSTNTQDGRGASFLSGSNFLFINNLNDSMLNNKVTIAAWIYPTDAGGSFQGIAGNETSQGYYMFIANNQLYCDILTSPGPIRTFSGGGIIENNKWQHVACAYDGTSLRWIINGTEVKRVAKTGTVNRNVPFQFIGWSGYSSESFKGYIDDVKIYAAAP